MNWQSFAKRLILLDGTIGDQEARLLRTAILEDAKIDRDEVAFLLDLKKSAHAVSPIFDHFLYKVLKRLVLADGKISDRETAWLERTLFAGGALASAETVRFLKDLMAEAHEVGPRFTKLYTKWVSSRSRVKARPSPAPPVRRAATPAGRPARPRTGAVRS